MRRIIACLALFGTLVSSGTCWAGAEESAKVEDAAEVMRDIMQIPEDGIPARLLRDAAGIAVIPGMVKAGFVLGGCHGKGLLAVRDERGAWTNASFIKMTGGSIGFQAGVQSTDVILVFRTRRSVDGIVNGTFTLGADASIAAGPLGREGRAATDGELKAEILSYSRSRGLFAGVALDGSKMNIDHDANEAAYGPEVTPRRIFAGAVPDVPMSMVDFRDLLEEASAR